MARRRGHRRGGFKIPIISIAILGGQVYEAHRRSGGDLLGTLAGIGGMYTGYNFANARWQPEDLAIGYLPWLAKRFLLPIARPRLGGVKLPVSLS